MHQIMLGCGASQSPGTEGSDEDGSYRRGKFSDIQDQHDKGADEIESRHDRHHFLRKEAIREIPPRKMKAASKKPPPGP